MSCGRPAAESAKRDITTEAWYGPTVGELAKLKRDAEAAYKNGKADDAAALIKKAEPLRDKVVAALAPTLAAMEAASDLDDLYGRMLLGNRHYGWARLMFQKNVARWKHWSPQTAESERRFKVAQSQVIECDRRMAE